MKNVRLGPLCPVAPSQILGNKVTRKIRHVCAPSPRVVSHLIYKTFCTIRKYNKMREKKKGFKLLFQTRFKYIRNMQIQHKMLVRRFWNIQNFHFLHV